MQKHNAGSIKRGCYLTAKEINRISLRIAPLYALRGTAKASALPAIKIPSSVEQIKSALAVGGPTHLLEFVGEAHLLPCPAERLRKQMI
jgi:hypothetical protein